MFYPTEYRAPDISRVKPILGSLPQPAEEEVMRDGLTPYPVPYEISRKY